MRKARVERNTKETQIRGDLKLEGRGRYDISTGVRFLDHMLELFAKHGGFDLSLHATGDLDVDQHHTVEDAGIVLGQLFARALGDRRGINRAGYFVQTMDETLAVVAVDFRRTSRPGVQGPSAREDRRRSANRTAGGFLRRVRTARGSESSREGSLRAIESSQD